MSDKTLWIVAAVAVAAFVFLRRGGATPNPATTDPLVIVPPASTGAAPGTPGRRHKKGTRHVYDIYRDGVLVGQSSRRAPQVNDRGAKPRGIPFGFGF